jgi:hypothetical protein
MIRVTAYCVCLLTEQATDQLSPGQAGYMYVDDGLHQCPLQTPSMEFSVSEVRWGFRPQVETSKDM